MLPKGQNQGTMAFSASASFTSLLLVSYLLLLAPLQFEVSRAHYHGAESLERERASVPLVNGLSWTFYKYSCPKVESIIRKRLEKIFKQDIGQAAGLLRLHFHDCFVQVTQLHFPAYIDACVIILNLHNPNYEAWYLANGLLILEAVRLHPSEKQFSKCLLKFENPNEAR